MAARRRASQAVISSFGSAPIVLRGAGPSLQYFGLHVAVVRSHGPVGCAVHDRIAERFEARDGESGRRRPERRPEALVGALMRVDRGGDGGIERIGWREADPPVIAQRRVKRDRARGDRDREPVQPGFGNQIEQGRGRDQIDRARRARLRDRG